jgi:hypothetical protein
MPEKATRNEQPRRKTNRINKPPPREETNNVMHVKNPKRRL